MRRPMLRLWAPDAEVLVLNSCLFLLIELLTDAQGQVAKQNYFLGFFSRFNS